MRLRHLIMETWQGLKNCLLFDRRTAWRKKNRIMATLSQKVPNISQGSVATRLRCDGIFNDTLVISLQLTMTMEEYLISGYATMVHGRPKTPQNTSFGGSSSPQGSQTPYILGDTTRPGHVTYVLVWSKSDQRRLRKTLHKQTDKQTNRQTLRK